MNSPSPEELKSSLDYKICSSSATNFGNVEIAVREALESVVSENQCKHSVGAQVFYCSCFS